MGHTPYGYRIENVILEIVFTLRLLIRKPLPKQMLNGIAGLLR